MKSDVCVCDADLLIELCVVHRLSLLRALFEQVLIPGRVCSEVNAKVRKTEAEASFIAASEEGWLEVVNLRDQAKFSMQQIRSMDILMESYRRKLDPGELEAAALLSELGIEVLLSNDREAKSVILGSSDIICHCLSIDQPLT